MENAVTITNTKENILDFQVTIQGVDTKDIKVCFVIETNEVNLSFRSTKQPEPDKWSVTIPPQSQLERTAYNFHIEVIADGYFFEGMRGVVNVVGPTDLYITLPKTSTLSTTNTPPTPVAPTKPVIQTTSIGHVGVAESAESIVEQALSQAGKKKPAQNKQVSKPAQISSPLLREVINENKHGKDSSTESKKKRSKHDIAVAAILEDINTDKKKAEKTVQNQRVFKKRKVVRS